MPSSSGRINFRDFVQEILKSVGPEQITIEKLPKPAEVFGRIQLIGVGKASVEQTQRAYELLSSHAAKLYPPIAFTKKGREASASAFQVFESSHPIPDESSVQAGRKVKSLLQSLKPEDHLVVLLSGGATSLVVSSQPGLDLEFEKDLFRQLLLSGASIEEMNQLRRETSDLRNGGWIRWSGADQVTTVITPDIPSADLGAVGSGPTIFSKQDPITIKKLAEKYLDQERSNKISNWLTSPKRVLAEAEVQRAVEIKKHTIHVLADAHAALIGGRNFLVQKGIRDVFFEKEITAGDLIQGVQGHLARIVQKGFDHPWAYLTAGEYTLKVSGKGQGGRNLEFVLRLALEVFGRNVLGLSAPKLKNIFILSIGTDGTDGVTNAAGAWLDYDTYLKMQQLGVDAEALLKDNDSLKYFEKSNSLIVTGPTGTNVMDLRLLAYTEEKWV